MMENKCVFTIGPESSGSMLIARILAHALDIENYGSWSGVGWCDNGQHKVCHRSLPFNIPPVFPDVGKWIEENQDNYDIFFVLTTRDMTLSEYSRLDRFPKNHEQVKIESGKARDIMIDVLQSGQKSFVWSYETFMFLGMPYLQQLYNALDIESDYMPPIEDGNRKRLVRHE